MSWNYEDWGTVPHQFLLNASTLACLVPLCESLPQWSYVLQCNRRGGLTQCGERNDSSLRFMIKALTCGNLVTSLSGLPQVPQDVVRVHIHQPADKPQCRPWRRTNQKLPQHRIFIDQTTVSQHVFLTESPHLLSIKYKLKRYHFHICWNAIGFNTIPPIILMLVHRAELHNSYAELGRGLDFSLIYQTKLSDRNQMRVFANSWTILYTAILVV